MCEIAGREASARAAALLVMLLAALCGSSAVSAQTVPPVDTPFEIANEQIFGGKYDRSIRGFFAFETDRIFGFVAEFENKTTNRRTNDAFKKFEEEAGASVDEVPIPSGSVSVRYAYDSTLETFVRQQRPFSPALSSNAATDGRGILTIGVSYSHLDYDKFDGKDHDAVALPSDPVEAFGPNVVDLLLFQFELRQSIYSISLQYGVLDNLDIGVFVPIFDQRFKGFLIDRFVLQNPDGSYTRVDSQGNELPPTRKVDRAFFNVAPGEIPNVGTSFEHNTQGVGDIVVRSRMHFGSVDSLDFGAAVNLSLPTGDEDDLMGVGAVRVDPRLLVSLGTDRFAVHTNQGFHIDVDESSRDRYDYSIGGELAVTPWASILLDQVGRIEIQGDSKVKKFDVVPGIKVNPVGNVVFGFNAVVPLNDDGLRTKFTPNATGELSVTF